MFVSNKRQNGWTEQLMAGQKLDFLPEKKVDFFFETFKTSSFTMTKKQQRLEKHRQYHARKRKTKENWIQGGGNRVSVHFAVTYLDCWRTSFCVITIIKIVNNNTNDKHTFGASLALDEVKIHRTNSCLFTLDRLPLLLLLRKN